MPFNPFAATLDAGTKAIEEASATTRRSSVMQDRAATLSDIDVGQTPAEVVYEENKLELLRYESQTEEQNEVPILVVYALINRPYILDLQPNRSVIRRLLEAGHDVYMIDWNEPSRLDQHLTLDDYVDRYLQNSVDEVRERSGQDAINLLGYCMGGTMSAMYAAMYPEKINALGLMAPPLYFERSGGVLESWGSEEYFEPEDIVETYGNVPADLLDDGFALMDPIDNYVTKYVTLFENVENEDFVENFARMERWLDEGIDLAGQAYVEFLEKIYHNNELYENELQINGRDVDINNIDMPTLMIAGEYDHLVPPSASKPFLDVISSEDTTLIEYATGHIGLSVSSSSHENVWPEVCEWYHEKSESAEEADEEAASTDDEDASSDEEDVSADVEAIQEVAAESVSEDDEAEPDAESAADRGDEAAPAGDAVDAAPVETIDGIGPTYADRLAAAGIETTADLAEHNAADLAEIAESNESRVQSWLDQLE